MNIESLCMGNLGETLPTSKRLWIGWKLSSYTHYIEMSVVYYVVWGVFCSVCFHEFCCLRIILGFSNALSFSFSPQHSVVVAAAAAVY